MGNAMKFEMLAIQVYTSPPANSTSLNEFKFMIHRDLYVLS